MKSDAVYLQHIRDAVGKIEKYASVGWDEFLRSSHWQDAIIRQLEIIGEASKNLSQEARTRESEVPWRRICGLRDVLIHNYMGVDLTLVWEVVQTHIPSLRDAVARLLDSIASD